MFLYRAREKVSQNYQVEHCGAVVEHCGVVVKGNSINVINIINHNMSSKA